MDKFNGKKIVIFAHSMGTANGGAAGVGIPEPLTYGGLLRVLNGCTIYRDAIPGSRISAPEAYITRMTNPDRWNTLDALFVPDIIILDAMINDYAQNVELGLLTDTEINTFSGALDYLFRNMLPRYPHSQLFLKLACHTTYNNPTCPEKNAMGVYLTDFIERAKAIAFRYGISIINSFQDSGINFYNNYMYTVDGIHHNIPGARKEYEVIRSTLNLKFTNPTPEEQDGGEEETPPTVIFNIKSNNVGAITYNESTNVLTAQTNSANYDFALTDDCNSAVIAMPVSSPVGLPAYCIGTDSEGNAVVLYTDGTGKISSFKKSGLVSEITPITVLDGAKPNAAKGAYVTIAHGLENVTISYGSYTRAIPYSLIPDLAVKSIGVLFTGAGVGTYIFDKIN